LKNLSWLAAALCLLLCGVLHLQSSANAEDVAPTMESGSTARIASDSAIDLLDGMDPAAKIYVWPNRTLPYEVFGEPPEEFGAAVQAFNISLGGRLELAEYGGFPLVSFNFYRQHEDHIEEFARRTNLASTYRDYIATLDFTVDPCAFTVSTDRGTWAAQAAVFIDLDRVPQQSLLNCLSVALDYIAGYPIPNDVEYQDVAPRPVRLPILAAFLDCSESGKTESPNPERSRDGVTALPSIPCAISHLQQ
jgi:hypothetical protein